MPYPGVNVGRAVEAGAAAPSREAIGLTMEAMGRQPFMGMIQSGVRRGAQARTARRIWNKAEYGDDPNEVAGADTAGEGSKLILTPRGQRELGGREHSAGINDRLGAMSQREETTSSLEDVVGNVLGGKSGGPMKIPKWRGGWSRRRGGA